MSNSARAGLFHTLSRGAVGLTEGLMTRDEVAVAKKRSELELQKLNAIQQSGTMEQEIQILKQQNEKILRDGARRTLFESFDLYNADGNTEHINRAIRGNELLREAMPEVTRIDKINVASDVELMRRNKLDPAIMEDKNMQGRFLKVTKPDGTTTIADFMTVMSGTGYLAYKDANTLQALLTRSQIAKNLATADKTEDSTDTSMVRNANATAEAEERIKNGKGTEADRNLVELYNKEVAGTTPGKADVGIDTTEALVNEFGGEDAFFATDFSSNKNLTRAYKYVTKIEQIEGSQLSTDTKKELRNIAALTALGAPGNKLSNEETGYLDNLLFEVKKYTTDKTSGIDATSAYAVFRNSVRHALYGSALTDAEIASFNEAFGTLKQKLGPVLVQFKSALMQVKGKLESIYRTENPYIIKVRVGADMDQVEKMLSALDQRIKYMEQASGGRAVQHITPDAKAKLDAKFKGAKQ